MNMNHEHPKFQRCYRVISGADLVKLMEFTHLQDLDSNVGGFGKKLLHLQHLDPKQILSQYSRIQRVRFIHQLAVRFL